MSLVVALKHRAIATEHPYRAEPLTEQDMRLASIAMGFTLGFGVFTFYHAFRQSRKLTIYSILCWTEITASGVFAIICYLYLAGVIPHSFGFFMGILTCWAIQVQLLLQIICNRICILIANPGSRFKLKYGVAGIILLVNISVYCIWIPARLQVSARYEFLNTIWDRCEKVIYLIVDAGLNYLFITMVRTRLVDLGLTKYDSLLTFNKRIICVSLSMDLLIIGLMSLPNSFVYMQFHPVAYIVKLEIEMAMSSIMIKVASASTGVEENMNNDTQIESKWEGRRTGPIKIRVDNVVEETVERDEHYPETLRVGRKMNRLSSDSHDYEEEDIKLANALTSPNRRSSYNGEKSTSDDDIELNHYPSALAKYDGFFPEPKMGDTTNSSLNDVDSPPRTPGQQPNPFQSSDSLSQSLNQAVLRPKKSDEINV